MDKMDMMPSLERFMRSYPDAWTESFVQHLVEAADTQHARSERSEAEERLHAAVTRMLAPMARMMEAEQGAMKVERQRMQDATLALQRVQEECHRALLDLTKQHNTSARDLEELGKALEANRQAAEEASKKLHLTMQKEKDLLIRLVCGGPSEFVHWARQEIHSQSMTHLTTDLERSWWPFTKEGSDSDCSITISPKREQEEDITCHQNAKCEKTSFPGTSSASFSCASPPPFPGACWASSLHPGLATSAGASLASFPGSSLVSLMVSETLRQVEESYRSVRGPFSLPSAVAGFWMGLAGRMTCLAIVTLFPQVMHTISTPGQSQSSEV